MIEGVNVRRSFRIVDSLGTKRFVVNPVSEPTERTTSLLRVRLTAWKSILLYLILQRSPSHPEILCHRRQHYPLKRFPPDTCPLSSGHFSLGHFPLDIIPSDISSWDIPPWTYTPQTFFPWTLPLVIWTFLRRTFSAGHFPLGHYALDISLWTFSPRTIPPPLIGDRGHLPFIGARHAARLL